MTAPALAVQTRYGGACPGCGSWRVYRPLPPRGEAPPRLPEMTVSCGRCGARVTLAADAGQSPRQPLVLARDDLDLARLRAHVREMHTQPRQIRRLKPVPRSNRDLAPWHWNQHHRYRPAHGHRGPWVLVADAHGRTVGQIPRPLGWYTGQDAVTDAQARAEWLARHP